MKIDLHIHTEKKLFSEPDTINISEENFIQELNKNDVGIAAITNHHYFNKEYYNRCIQIIKQNEYDIVLLPGIELDFKIEHSKRILHFNLIFSQANSIYKNNIDFDEYIKNPNVHNLKKIISKTEYYIFYLDKKSSKRKWEQNDENWLKDQFKEYNIVYISDLNNKSSHLIYRAHNLNSLIGSDIKDWTKYNEKSKYLLDIGIDNINSFDSIFKLLKYDSDFLNELLKKEIPYKLNLDIKDNNKIEKIGEISIYKGLNVVFGAKASGKSELLLSIKNNLIEKEKISFFDYKMKFSEVKEKINNDLKINDEMRKEINNSVEVFKEILNYKEEGLTNLNDFRDYFENEQKNRIIFLKSIIKKNIKNTKEDNQSISFKKMFNNLEEILEEINGKGHNFNEEILKYVKPIKEFKEVVFNSFYRYNKPFFISRFWELIINKNNEILRKNKGQCSLPNSIFLFKIWEKRINLKNKINILSNKITGWIQSKKLDITWWNRTRSISIARKITFKIFRDDLKMKGLKKLDKNNFRNFILDAKNMISLLGDKKKLLEIQNIISIFFDNKEIMEEEIIFVDENKNEIKLSSGEEMMISIENSLDNDSNIYILDEPDIYLDSFSIFNFLIKKINELKKANKTIIIATHNPKLAINSIPFNMIYRENFGQKYLTYIGNPWINFFSNINDESDKKGFTKLLLDKFECDKEHFIFRKEIYDI